MKKVNSADRLFISLKKQSIREIQAEFVIDLGTIKVLAHLNVCIGKFPSTRTIKSFRLPGHRRKAVGGCIRWVL